MPPFAASVRSAPAKLKSFALNRSLWFTLMVASGPPRPALPLRCDPVPHPSAKDLVILQGPVAGLPWAAQRVLLVPFSESLELIKLEVSVSLCLVFFLDFFFVLLWLPGELLLGFKCTTSTSPHVKPPRLEAGAGAVCYSASVTPSLEAAGCW